ncbi:hypothetical protein ACVWW4_007903 [Bradyrhizobium sp. LB7.1]
MRSRRVSDVRAVCALRRRELPSPPPDLDQSRSKSPIFETAANCKCTSQNVSCGWRFSRGSANEQHVRRRRQIRRHDSPPLSARQCCGGGRHRHGRRCIGCRRDRQPSTQRSRMDEGAGRTDGKPALWRAVTVREGCRQEHLEDSQAVHIGLRPDSIAGARWHHHAERTVLRAASRRRSDHRSGSAPVDAARAGRASADLHNGRSQAFPVGIARPLSRMLRQSRLQQALRQDSIGPCGSGELCGMDRRQSQAGAPGGRVEAGSQMGRRRGPPTPLR